MIDIRYQNTEKQFADFSMYRAVNSESYKKEVKRKSIMMAGMFIIAGFVYGFVGIKGSDAGKAVIGTIFSSVFLIMGILSYLFFGKFINKNVRKSIINTLRKDADVIGQEFRFKFDGKLIRLYKNKEKSNIKLDSILEVTELNECLCIAVKGNAGIVIPHSAFKKEEDRILLENKIKEHLKIDAYI